MAPEQPSAWGKEEGWSWGGQLPRNFILAKKGQAWRLLGAPSGYPRKPARREMCLGGTG